ncbi:hypothetical protein [Desulfosporosinus sp. FKA]|uniref:hypothetical protein n=1 Tax=Desulfosporosinus sp. FKA TaxID=1969834 RepID=UPI000B49EE77|nr:hypothetical protein [Desulfosporosinus sp. FKA]
MRNAPINTRNLDDLSLNMHGSLFNGKNELIQDRIAANEYKGHYPTLSEVRDRQAIQALIQTVLRR